MCGGALIHINVQKLCSHSVFAFYSLIQTQLEKNRHGIEFKFLLKPYKHFFFYKRAKWLLWFSAGPDPSVPGNPCF